MNTAKNAQMRAYFDAQLARCSSAEQVLIADARADEAVFAKIQENVFDIFRTVFQAALNTQKDEAAAEQFFGQKLEEIPRNWRTALEKAQANGDVERAHIEQLKLDALEEIKATFAAIREG